MAITTVTHCRPLLAAVSFVCAAGILRLDEILLGTTQETPEGLDSPPEIPTTNDFNHGFNLLQDLVHPQQVICKCYPKAPATWFEAQHSITVWFEATISWFQWTKGKAVFLWPP